MGKKKKLNTYEVTLEYTLRETFEVQAENEDDGEPTTDFLPLSVRILARTNSVVIGLCSMGLHEEHSKLASMPVSTADDVARVISYVQELHATVTSLLPDYSHDADATHAVRYLIEGLKTLEEMWCEAMRLVAIHTDPN